jgi:hypothetical protein
MSKPTKKRPLKRTRKLSEAVRIIRLAATLQPRRTAKNNALSNRPTMKSEKRKEEILWQTN